MQRSIASFFAVCLFFVSGLFAQEDTTAVCDFDPNSQLAVNYQPISVDTSERVLGHQIPYDKVWAPGGKPMTMFLNHPVTFDGKDIPVGAYTMFAIPDDDKWTLIVSRSTDMSGKYDEHQDLMRVPMQWGQLSSPESRFSIYFAHSASANAPCGSISGRFAPGSISKIRNKVAYRRVRLQRGPGLRSAGHAKALTTQGKEALPEDHFQKRHF
jgi:hypothetical protein